METLNEQSGFEKLKVAVDWALKIGPVIGAVIFWVFSLYTNQAAMMKHDVTVDNKLSDLDRDINKQNREFFDRLAKADAQLDELRREIDFLSQTQRKP